MSASGGGAPPQLVLVGAGVVGLVALLCLSRKGKDGGNEGAKEVDAPAAPQEGNLSSSLVTPKAEKPAPPSFSLGQCVRAEGTKDDHNGMVGKVVDAALATSDPAKHPRVGVKFQDGKTRSVKAELLVGITAEQYEAAAMKGKETQVKQAKQDQAQRLNDARERARARAAARKAT